MSARTTTEEGHGVAHSLPNGAPAQGVDGDRMTAPVCSLSGGAALAPLTAWRRYADPSDGCGIPVARGRRLACPFSVDEDKLIDRDALWLIGSRHPSRVQAVSVSSSSGRGVYGCGPSLGLAFARRLRSISRNDRRVEVIVQAGAEDMLVHLGAVGRGNHGAAGNGNPEGARRRAEIDVEIFGLRGPVRCRTG